MTKSTPTKILIVDDEPDIEVLMTQRFRRQLREKKFIFCFAQSGIEALELLSKNQDIHLVISDINMPEMDGLTLLKKISEKFPAVIPIIVSAYGDMNNIRAAMNLGAFDFITKPINFEDLTVTIDKTLAHIQNLMTAKKNKRQLDSILHELNVASEIQQSILPHNFIKNESLEIFAEMAAAKEVGGDFYDFFWVDKEKTKLALVIADVSGKGVAAALFMTVSRTLIRAHAYSKDKTPGACLDEVNNILCKDNKNVMFVTTFYAILDLQAGTLSYCNAGHNRPYIVHSDGKVEAISQFHGMALGVTEDNHYKEDTLNLRSGDVLFLYTDGVTEAEKSDGNMYGEKRLMENLNQHKDLAADELVHTIKSEISQFVSGYQQSDDITILAMRYVATK